MIRSVFAALALALFAVTPAAAFHRKTDVVVQITGDGGGTIANPHWSGFQYVLFDSDADLVGNSNTTRQVFLYDLHEHDLTGARAIYQVTTGADDNRRGDGGMRAHAIVYDARPGGTGARQLLAVDRRAGTKHAITQGTADSVNVDVDDSGRWAVFESAADLLGGGGATGTQIYRLDLHHADPTCPFPCPANGNLGLTRVTNKAGTSRNAVTSRRGKSIAFESDADLLTPSVTGMHVYVFDADGTLARVSSGPRPSHNPTISRQGHVIAFESDDAAGGTQITLYKRATATSLAVTAVPGAHNTRPSFEASGRSLIFMSDADLVPNGSTGTQVFRYDVRARVLTQITHASAIGQSAFSAGSFVTFVSSSDLLGNGSTGLDLYLVNLFKLGPASVP